MSTSVYDLAVNISTNIASLNEGMAKASDVVNRTAGELKTHFEGVQSRIDSVTSAFYKLAAAVTIGIGIKGLSDIVTGAIEARAHLVDLATKIGTTTSALSSLIPAAKLSATSLDDIASASAKFSKNLAGSEADSGKAAAALKNLGFTASDTARFLKDPTQGMFELAKRTKEFANDGALTANLMAVMGKGAQELKPFLKALGAQTELTARVTDQQGRAAKELVDQYRLLELRTSSLKSTIAGGLVPVLSNLLKAFTDATSGPQSLSAQIKALADDGSLGIWVQKIVIGLAVIGESFFALGKSLYAFAGSIKVVFNDISTGLAAAQLTGAISTGDPTAIANALQAYRTSLETRQTDLEDANQRYVKAWGDEKTAVSDILKAGLVDLEANTVAFNKTLAAREEALRQYNSTAKIGGNTVSFATSDANDARLRNSLAGSTRSVDTKGLGGGDPAGKIDEYAKALQRFREMAAAANAALNELLDGKKITAAQKAFEQIKVSDVWKTFTAGQKEAIDGLAKVASEAERLTELTTRLRALTDELDVSQLGFAKDFQAKFATLTEAFNAGIVSLERYRELTQRLLDQQPFAKKEEEAMKLLIKAEERVIELLGKMKEDATQALGAYADQNTRIEAEIGLIGLSNEERATALVLLDAQADRQKLINADDYAGLAILDEQISKRQTLVTVQNQLQERAAAWGDVFKSAADAGSKFLTDFVEHGSSAFKNLWGDFKKWALEALAKIAAQKIVVSIAGAIGLGGAGNALAGSGGPLGAILGGGSPGGGLGSFLSNLFGGGGPAGGGGFGQNDRGLGVSNSFGGIGDLFSRFTGGLSTIGGGFSNFFDLVSSGTGIFSAAGTAFSGMGGALTAVLGPIGLIGGAVALLSGLLKKGGGPKEAGFAASPGFTGQPYYPGETSAPGNEAIAKIVAATVTTYGSTLAALGGKAAKDIILALGFDKDPKGTASNRVTIAASVGGQSVYSARDIDVGRKDEDLQARLGLEAQRALLAALQASELPEYIASILNGVDAATATSEQINKIIATAQALKQAVTIVSGLGDQFAKLKPEQIQGLIAAFGGLDNFAKSFAFIGQNFTTTADRMKQSQAQLNTAFADLGIAVPKTHQQFLDLLNSLDLTTESGQQTYASLVNVAPLFVQVAGSADQAAAALEKLVVSATDFFSKNFYSGAEQQAAKLAEEMQQINAAQSALGLSIPTTIAGFRALIESIDQTTPAGQALYAALIVLAPAIFDVATQATNAAGQIVQAANSLNNINIEPPNYLTGIQDRVTAFLSSIATLSQQIPHSDLGTQLGLQIDLVGKKMANLRDGIAAAWNHSDAFGAQTLQLELDGLTAANDSLVAQLAHFTTLSAQYGSAMATQLVELESWYAEQQRALAGNVDALAALGVIFGQRWTAIVAGTSDAVTSVAEAIDSFIKKIQQLAGAVGGNAGQEARLELAQSKPKLDQLQTQYAKLAPNSALGPALLAQINTIKAYNDGLAKQVADFTIYTAQYGAAGANQLVALERQYSEQQQVFAGNSEALGILDEIFNEKWNAIISGLSGGVDGSLEQLNRLRKGIADYLQGLQVGSLSPLTPLQKLQQAQTDFEAEVAKAQGGDQGALGDVTKFADVFLNLARDAYASGQQYTDIFNTVNDQLRGLASPITSDSNAVFSGANDAVHFDSLNSLSVALPANGGRLVSADDAKVLGDRIIAAIFEGAQAHADANSQDSQTLTLEMRLAKTAIVDAVNTGLK